MEPVKPNMINDQFLILIQFGQLILTAMSRNAGVIIDKVDIQTAPESEMNKSKSGTANAIPSIK
jgi:hypothetical protein